MASSSRRPRRAKTVLTMVAAGILIVVVCGLATVAGVFSSLIGGASRAQSASADDAGDMLTQPVKGASGPVQTRFGDGEWLVGTDIAAGTYRAKVPVDSVDCLWERASSADGTAASVIDSGQAAAGTLVAVAVKPTDAVFRSTGCGEWTRLR